MKDIKVVGVKNVNVNLLSNNIIVDYDEVISEAIPKKIYQRFRKRIKQLT